MATPKRSKKSPNKARTKSPFGASVVIHVDANGVTLKDLLAACAGNRGAVNIDARGHSDIPAIGQPWKGQGGIYAGRMRGSNGQPDYHLVLATDSASLFKDIEYGAYGKEIAGAGDEFDGAKNTAALVKAGGHPLAEKIAALKIEGHADFYLPSRFESALLYATVRDKLESDYWHWTSTQDSADNAWYQHFSCGSQGWSSKYSKGRARAVRRVAI